MTALREAAQQVLQALERYQVKRQDFDMFADEITALRAALRQEEEASAWLAERKEYWRKEKEKMNLRAALAQQADPETCTWHQDGDSDSGVYATSCRHYFNLEDGTPEDNKMQWCCYCGKKLVQELITEDA
jgi:hypothetical protein